MPSLLKVSFFCIVSVPALSAPFRLARGLFRYAADSQAYNLLLGLVPSETAAGQRAEGADRSENRAVTTWRNR